MTPAAPHLLTLPREIRDKIYSYLFKIVDFQVVITTDKPSVFVRIENAPLPAVSLVHSQMHGEYLDADCFRNRVATIRSTYFFFIASTTTTMETKLGDTMLGGVQHVNLYSMDEGIPNHSTPTYSISELANYLGSKMPLLRSIRAVTLNIGRYLEIDSSLSVLDLLPLNIHSVRIQDANLLGLPVVQRGECWHVIWFGQTQCVPQSTTLGVNKLIFALYTLERSRQRFWTADQVARSCTSHKPSKDVLDELSEEEINKLNMFASQVFKWTEERGDEIKL